MNSPSDSLPKALRLFLSVDIAGSTAYKSQEPDRVQPWLPALYKFFSEFPVSLAAKYDGATKAPTLWKTLGDEMVFVTTITDHLEVATHICHFRDTIASYRETIKDASKKLDLKGAAWLAGFPVGNTLLSLPRNGDGTRFEDYLGPSIDNGFRLSKHATPRKFVLSVETAYLLLSSAHPVKAQRPEVFLERGEELKGVLDGRPYPKLWIGVPYRNAEKFRELEEALLDPPSDHKEGKLQEYCKLFIEEYGSPLFVPFIVNDKIFGTPSDGYTKQYEEVCELWSSKMGQHLKKEPETEGDKRPTPDLEKKIEKLGKDRQIPAVTRKPQSRRRPRKKG